MTNIKSIDIKALIRLTLNNPRQAAHQIMALQIPRQILWLALALMSVLNGIVYSISTWMNPPAEVSVEIMPTAFHSPVFFTGFLFAGLIATVLMLHRLGQAMGGKAALGDILILITWLQVLRLMVQLGLSVFLLVAPGLVGLLAIIIGIWGIYILICFIDEAHQYGSLGKAAWTMILTSLAIAFGLMLILLVFGTVLMGVG